MDFSTNHTTKEYVMPNPTGILTTVFLFSATLGAHTFGAGDTLNITRDTPTIDRWMYPFNATPGYRPAASTFGIWTGEGTSFDNLDAQMVIGFETASDVPVGTASDWQVASATVTLQLSNSGTPYDETVDVYQTFLEPSDPEWIEDVDQGQPIELFGTDYRYDFTSTTWTEDAAFGSGDTTAIYTRSAYAAGFRDGELVDVSNHVRERWTPTPFSVGTVPGLANGDILLADDVLTFDIDVSDPNIQNYLLDGIDEGILSFTLASMTIVEFGGVLPFPLFYCKENVAVEFGIASAATLNLVLEPASSGNPCDFNGDGVVDGADLSRLLGAWATSDAEVDLDGNGFIDGADLAALLGCWS